MKGIVWGQTYEKANEKLNEIIVRYKESYVEYKRLNYREVIFSNGDIWIAMPVKENFRGQRYNISYIDKGIPEEIVHELILPCTTAFPYQGFQYY